MKKLFLLTALLSCLAGTKAWNIFNTSNSGIPSNNIRAIEFDRQGNAWIATDSGLVKHNGTTWQVYRTSNSGIVSNDVLCVKIDKKNIKWIGTSTGLSKFNDTSWVTYTTTNSGLPDNNIFNIQIDNNDKIFIIFQPDIITPINGKGFCTFNEGAWSHYTTQNSSLFTNSIRQMLIDSFNKKWILYSDISKYTIVDTLENWTTNNNPEFGGVLSITEGDNNTKWFGLTNGLGLYTDSGWISIGLPSEITNLGLPSYVRFIQKFKNSSKIWTEIKLSNGLSYFSLYDIQLRNWIVFTNIKAPIDYSNFGWFNFNLIQQDKLNNTWVIARNGLIKSKCISNTNWSIIDSVYSCKMDSVKLTYRGDKNPSLWLSDNGFIGKNSSNYFYAKDTGFYKLYFTDNNGCSILGSSKYNVGNSFKAQITSNQDVVCLKNNQFSLNVTCSEDTIGSKFKWNLVKTSSSLGNPTIVFDTAGNYKISVIATSIGGCVDSASKTLKVNPDPIAGPLLGETNALITTKPYLYQVAQQPNHTYNWTITNGIITAGQGTNAATVQWLSNGKGYVKVEVTNAFGCADTTASAVNIGNVGLGEISSLNHLAVYPNPNKGNFNISFTAVKTLHLKLSLINLLGQEMWSEQQMIQAGQQTLPINSDLAPGVYTLRINNAEEQIQQKIIIK